MKLNYKRILGILSIWLLWPGTTHHAYAYLDPGSGSMLVQALIAVIAAVSVSLSVFWRRLRSFLNRILGRSSSGERDSDAR